MTQSPFENLFVISTGTRKTVVWPRYFVIFRPFEGDHVGVAVAHKRLTQQICAVIYRKLGLGTFYFDISNISPMKFPRTQMSMELFGRL